MVGRLVDQQVPVEIVTRDVVVRVDVLLVGRTVRVKIDFGQIRVADHKLPGRGDRGNDVADRGVQFEFIRIHDHVRAVGGMESEVFVLRDRNTTTTTGLASVHVVENKRGECDEEVDGGRDAPQAGMAQDIGREQRGDHERDGHGHHELAQVNHVGLPEEILREKRECTAQCGEGGEGLGRACSNAITRRQQPCRGSDHQQQKRNRDRQIEVQGHDLVPDFRGGDRDPLLGSMGDF